MKNIVQTIKTEIAALRRLAKTVPDDALAQASIAGQINALAFVMGRAAAVVLCAAALLLVVTDNGSAQTGSPATLRPNSLAIDSGTKTATAVSGAVTLNKGSGIITTESLSTAAAGTYTLTLTDSAIAATDIVFASVWLGTDTTGIPEIMTATPGAGSAVITVHNDHASAAFNGTLKIGFFVLKQP